VQRAFTHAFDEVFGLEDLSIDVITHHGLTDPLVAQRTLVCAGISAVEAEARWPEVAASMLRYAALHTADAGQGLEVLPGVAALLAALQARGATVGLVTGNLTPIGWAKMEALALLPFFTEPRFGGFGSDHSERGELVKIAGQRARLLAPHIRTAWHVGDTVRACLRLP
jgi:phosphoglycolate phosphatase